MSEDHLIACFNCAKKEGAGEDADPLFCDSGQTQWIGVFDGMGGAGATAYETANGPRSGAYLASRTVASVCADWATGEAERIAAGQRAISLHEAVSRGLVELREALPPSTSRIRGRLLKTFPTTVALAGGRDMGCGAIECNILWAGDSRVYYMTPERGLVQVTVDHLENPLDAQQNLTADSPLGNFASADAPFFIEEVLATIRLPVLLIAATDGCFGYVYSPQHFERMLLTAINATTDHRAFETYLRAQMSGIGGDDASIAIAGYGWENWGALRAAFLHRLSIVDPLVDCIDDARRRVQLAEDVLRKTSADLAELTEFHWGSYRVGYEGRYQTTRAPL